MNIGRFLTRSARYWPNRPAVIFRDQPLSYRELDQRSSQLAHALLALGLAKGERVAIQSWNQPELIEIESALYKAGLVKVALNARLSDEEARDTFSNAEPAVLIAGPAHAARLSAIADGIPSIRHRIVFGADAPGYRPYEDFIAGHPTHSPDVELEPGDLAVLHFTSGSTGKLKAAMQTTGNRMASIRKVVMGRMRAQPGDVLALAGPITHASGMFMQPFLTQGGTLLLHERFSPEAYLESLQKYRVTHAFVVPTMINMLLAHPGLKDYDLGSLKTMTYGSAPIAPARIREAWRAFGPVLSQGYGAGETTGGLVTLSIQDHHDAIEGGREELLSSCGRVFGESDLRLFDDEGREVAPGEIGEIVVRGPDVFAGYWREPELSAAALEGGWLHTGDLARMDELGYLYIVDRKKDMIISGGFNVYPSEVEAALYRHPAVYETCVIGVPDETWGEAVKAVVVLKEGEQADPDALIRHCAALLADFKKPRSVDFVSELPKNGNGKLSRKEVKERYWAGQARRVA
ncbi:class I adenylate-forming enzyme family protein [Pigmentiphaga daeguensis]|uniref:Long-chain fatty acid--CoA ligase n=1 Tax=Pigmentiphaga daeguensis TaxID=414049 RepID=A0ABP3MA26_9BURK